MKSLLKPDARFAPPATTAAPLPFFTVDDLLWLLYLYPLRFLAAAAPVGLIHSTRGLFALRARKRKKIAAQRMLAAKCADIARDLFRVGLCLTILESLVLLVLTPFYWPLIGIR